MLFSCFGGLTNPHLSTFSRFSPKRRASSPATPRPIPPRHVHPPAADLLSRPLPAPHPPKLAPPALAWIIGRSPSPTDSYGRRPRDAADCGCGEFELTHCRDHGYGRRLGGFGSRATERRPSLHRGGTGLHLPKFPLVTGSIQPFLLVTVASEGGMARREASTIGRQLRGPRPARTVAARSPAPRTDGENANPSHRGTPAPERVCETGRWTESLETALISF